MAGRPPRVAGCHLTLRRIAATAALASAIGASTAFGANEWVVTAGPTQTQPSEPGQWVVTPAPGSQWNATPGGSAPAPEQVSGDEILAQFVGIQRASDDSSQTTPQVPPVAPTAIDVPSVELDKDHPAVKALAAAQERANTLEARLASLHMQLDTASPSASVEIEAKIAQIEPKVAAANAEVTKLTRQVDAIKKELAAKQAALAANQYATVPGLTYAPVSGTVPVIDANLASRIDAYLAASRAPLQALATSSSTRPAPWVLTRACSSQSPAPRRVSARTAPARRSTIRSEWVPASSTPRGPTPSPRPRATLAATSTRARDLSPSRRSSVAGRPSARATTRPT